jgi:hypothetical protein
MKKITFLILMFCAFAVTTFAQDPQVKETTKVKKTSSLGQKVHNTFSKHKRHNGYKVKKTRVVNGKEVKEKTKVKDDKH